MQYLIIARDGTDKKALERRMAIREQHIALGDKLKTEGKVLYGVAMLNEKGQMCGSVYICHFDSREELDEYLKIEPYVVGNVWKEIEIKECKVGPSFK